MVPDEVEVRTKTTKNRGNKAATAAYKYLWLFWFAKARL